MMKEIYDIHDDIDNKDFRYILGKTVDSSKQTALCIGVNPSTANSTKKDLTMTIVENMLNKEYGRFIMMNLTPQRNSKVDNLELSMNEEYLTNNIETYKNIIKKYNIKTVICAWGDSINKRKYLYDNLKKIYNVVKKENKDCQFYNFKLTNNGNPMHPRRIQYIKAEERQKIKLNEFKIEKYIENI